MTVIPTSPKVILHSKLKEGILWTIDYIRDFINTLRTHKVNTKLVEPLLSGLVNTANSIEANILEENSIQLHSTDQLRVTFDKNDIVILMTDVFKEQNQKSFSAIMTPQYAAMLQEQLNQALAAYLSTPLTTSKRNM